IGFISCASVKVQSLPLLTLGPFYFGAAFIILSKYPFTASTLVSLLSYFSITLTWSLFLCPQLL
ncbi:hypothetical protein BJY52DRAFT_1167045, partial [Lactarius psammicola]